MTGNGISTVDALLFRAAILWGRLATSRVGRKKLCWEVLSTSAPNGVRNAAFAGMIPVAVAALQVAAEPGVGLLVKIYGHSIHGTEGKMTKRMVSGLFIGLGMLVVANVAAWAQASNDGVITINGGRNSVLMSAPSQTITLAAGPSPELVTIYSNLGKGSKVYNAISGVGILGTDAGQPWPQSVGCGFVPKADHIVTEIQVGATYVQGTNTVVVSLNQDNNGIPGKALHTWHFSNLPVFGSCCTLQTAKYAKEIKVKKGKLYWVVLRPQAKFQDTYDVWNDNAGGKQGTWSNNIGSGWNSSYQVLGAFGVFGK